MYSSAPGTTRPATTSAAAMRKVALHQFTAGSGVVSPQVRIQAIKAINELKQVPPDESEQDRIFRENQLIELQHALKRRKDVPAPAPIQPSNTPIKSGGLNTQDPLGLFR